ncbi:MAG TPA: Na/Pi cotransporter family protein [Clostridiales bacterium]|nr:Na/Pi cotransporter family protein [Clostridiales bacterium]
MATIIIILVNIVAGSACLIYGVNLISDGLEKINLHRIRHVLTRFTKNVPMAFLTGTIITALVQSSTAVTVITVGLVNTGIIGFSQAIGIIYGANVGTTITAQFMSFKITDFAPAFISLGLAIKLLGKKYSVRNVGRATIGFGLMLLGINILGWSMPYMEKSEFVRDIFLKYGKNPYLGIIVGMLATMIVHSSSATVGFTIVLFNSGFISFDAALGLVLGDNIGTCFTTVLASIDTTISAKRTAWAHVLYNIIGSLTALALLSPFSELVKKFTVMIGQDMSRLVANAHTLFNILSALLFLPFTRYYERFVVWIIGNEGIR